MDRSKKNLKAYPWGCCLTKINPKFYSKIKRNIFRAYTKIEKSNLERALRNLLAPEGHHDDIGALSLRVVGEDGGEGVDLLFMHRDVGTPGTDHLHGHLPFSCAWKPKVAFSNNKFY